MMSTRQMNLSSFRKIELTPASVERYSIRMPKLKFLPLEGHIGYLWLNSKDTVVAYVNVMDIEGPRRLIQSLYMSPKLRGLGLYSQLVNFAVKQLRATDMAVGKTDILTYKTFINLGFKEVSNTPAAIILSNANDKRDVSFIKANNLKPVFVILTHSSVGFSKFVKFMTNATYSHASISFDSSLMEVYSFASRGKDHTLISLGFSEENLIRFLQQDPGCQYALYVMFVPLKDLDMMKKRVASFKESKADYRYDVAGVVKNFFNKRSINDKNKFCSGFVAEILNSGSKKITHKDADMMRPEDIMDIPNIHFVDAGLLRNYDKRAVDRRVEEIYKRHYIR